MAPALGKRHQTQSASQPVNLRGEAAGAFIHFAHVAAPKLAAAARRLAPNTYIGGREKRKKKESRAEHNGGASNNNRCVPPLFLSDALRCSVLLAALSAFVILFITQSPFSPHTRRSGKKNKKKNKNSQKVNSRRKHQARRSVPITCSILGAARTLNKPDSSRCCPRWPRLEKDKVRRYLLAASCHDMINNPAKAGSLVMGKHYLAPLPACLQLSFVIGLRWGGRTADVPNPAP